MQDVTASDVGAVCGVSPYKTPLQVYGEKLGILRGPDENVAMKRGRWLEPAALFALQEERPTWDVRKANVYLRDPDLRIGATPDLVVHDPEREGIGNVQIKTATGRSFASQWMGPDESIEAPLHYQLQTLTEAKLMGASWASILLLVLDHYTCDLHLIDVPLHDAAWERIKGDVKMFWWHVTEGLPPPIVPSQDGPTLRKIYAKDDGEVLDLSKHNQLPELLAERAEIMADIDSLKDAKEEIDAQVMEIMQEASVGELPGWRISWKVQHKKAFTVAARDTRVLKVFKREEKDQ
jgi:predicted phage-related endonuclease